VPSIGRLGLQIAHFLAGLGRQGKRLGVEASPATVNGHPGAIVYLPGERVVSTVALEIAGDKIVAIRAVVDPEKLQHVRAPA
jgi:RNA polymerase sigma-70 factor (ECF subfamily)